MSKLTEIVNGQIGSAVRAILNALIPGRTVYAPEAFVWTADLSAHYNRVLVVSYDHDLGGGGITIPFGCTLKFKGGQLLNVGTLTGSSSRIVNNSNLQCFDTNITFAGIWIDTVATPQWFGAICTANPNTLPGPMVVGGNVALNQRNEGGATSSSAAIQALFDSPFKPYFPNGYYYITTPVTVTRQIFVDFGTPVKEMIDEMSSFYYKNDHVRFYTDQNTGFWIYRKHGIYLRGGVMDIRNAIPYNSKVYHIKADVPIWGGEASGDAVGSLAGARFEGGTGTYFHWDTADTSLYGYITKFVIRTHSLYINYGIIIDSPSTGGVNCWANGFQIEDAYFDGSKQSININDSGGGLVNVTSQTRDVLNLSEQYIWQKIINSPGNVLNGFVWDVRAGAVGGWYRTDPSRTCLISQAGTKMEGSALDAVYYVTDPLFLPQSRVSITQKSRITLLQSAALSPVFISDIHNSLPTLSAINKGTVGAFQGATIDFNTEFRDAATLAVPAAPNISLTNTASVFRGEGKCTFQFVAGANADTDFVEFHSVFSDVQLNRLFLHLNEDNCAIRRIQVIGKNSSDAYYLIKELLPVQSNTYRLSSFEVDLGNLFYRGLLIRMVGVLSIQGLVRVLDYAVKRSVHNQTFVSKIDDYRFKYAAILNQLGENAPVISEKLNTTGLIVTSSYNSVGDYFVNCANLITVSKADLLDITNSIYVGTSFFGTVRINRDTDSRYRIRTWDNTGTPANGILNSFSFSFNIAW